MNKCIFLIFLIVSIASASQEDKIMTKRIYPDISKDAIFNATKILFSLSNKSNENNDFIINSYRNKLEVEKVVFRFRITNVKLFLDKWLIEVQEFDNESRVIFSYIRNDAVEFDDNQNMSESIINLFFDRLDYILGLNKTWKPCYTYFNVFPYLSANYCYKSLLDEKPDDSVILNNILISQKNHNLNTIDTVKTDILLSTDLQLQKNNKYILEEDEDILNTNILTPVMENSILETKAIKIKVKKEKESKETNDVKEEMQNSDESIDEFKDNMKDIVNMKNSLNDKDIEKIITESNDLKENSEFSLESN